VPAIVCLAVAGIAACSSDRFRRVAAGLLVAASLASFVAKTDLIRPLVGERSVDVMGHQNVPYSSGLGQIQTYQLKIAHGRIAKSGRLSAIDRKYLPAAARLSTALEQYAAERGRGPVVFFATADPLFNVNTLGLASRYLLQQPPVPVGQLDPRVTGDSVAAYRERMANSKYGWPNLLVTSDRSTRDFNPSATQAFAEEAARSLGFQPAFTFALPDGRALRIWWLLRGPVR
jgi:hypothetical protein